MFEPVGTKQETWYINEPLKCPTKEYPYIFTSKNSPKTFDKNTTAQRVPVVNDSNSTSLVNTTDNSTSAVSSNVTFSTNSTGDYTYMVRNSTAKFQIDISNNIDTDDVNIMDRDSYQPSSDKKSKSESSINKIKLVAVSGFSLLVIVILIVGIVRRQKRLAFISSTEDGNFNRLSEESEDDVDMYTRPTQQSGYSDDKITKTHGVRVPLD